jgi:hypothetical protein
MVKVNDWGPYDYHRDFNLTFPLQLMADISTNLSKPSWFELPNSRLGLRYTWRSLDQYSPRYSPATTLNDRGQPFPTPRPLVSVTDRNGKYRPICKSVLAINQNQKRQL